MTSVKPRLGHVAEQYACTYCEAPADSSCVTPRGAALRPGVDSVIDMKEVGARIAIARVERGLTQALLAKTLGLTPMTISCYENATRTLSVPRLAQIAEALRVPIVALLESDADSQDVTP